MPGLKAAQPRSGLGSWHGLSAWWELSIPGDAGGADQQLQVCTKLQPLVLVNPSWPLGHWFCAELPKGEADSPDTGWGSGGEYMLAFGLLISPVSFPSPFSPFQSPKRH